MQGPNTNSLFNNNTNQTQQIQLDTTSNDDFLKQMLSTLPSSSWTSLDPKPNPPLWQPNSDETTPDNVVFPYDLEHSNLSSKFRNHQINDNDKSSALMLQHHLLISNPSLLHNMPLTSFHPSPNDVVHAPSFKSPSPTGDAASVQALFNRFSGSLQPSNSNQTQHFQQPQVQSVGGSGQPKQRVRARRGQATDPHSIAERLRRERIAERMKALQELVPNANKTDKASMLDEIIDYVKFLQVQVKVLSMSRLGGAPGVAPLVADVSYEGRGGDSVTAKGASSNGHQESSNDTLTMTEQQVAKLMEEDMGSAMQYLQGKGLCLMPISLATAISKATCRTTNHFINNNINGCDGPPSPGISALTVQSVTVGNGVVKDSASISKS